MREKAYKLRLYPNKEQMILINKTIGSTRLIYNMFLAFKQDDYNLNKTSNSYVDCSKILTKAKISLPFLKEVDKFALQNSLKNLDRAYKNFFKSGFGYPKFKSKHGVSNSYITNFTNNNIEVFDKQIKLPKLGKIKYKGYRNNNIGSLKIISATISKNNLNQYYCSILVKEDIEALPTNTNQVGIDLGVKSLITLSSGETISNERVLFAYEEKLKKAQRKLSKKQKGSQNRNKQRLKVAKIHKKIANIREDFLQKVSTKIIRENQIICIEDLSVKTMISKKTSLKGIAKELLNVALNKFVSLLTYKATWYGRTLSKVDKYFPSSQLCNCCGYKNTLLVLGTRKWTCPSCKTKLERDHNASLNILQEGLRLLSK